MTESYRRTMVEKSSTPSISSINININMNVQPSLMNGKRIDNGVQLKNIDHLVSMRPNISTQSLARNKRQFLQSMSMHFNQKQSCKKASHNIQYDQEYLQTFNHQDEIQFEMYNNLNNNSLKSSKHVYVHGQTQKNKTKWKESNNNNKSQKQNGKEYFNFNQLSTIKKKNSNIKVNAFNVYENNNRKSSNLNLATKRKSHSKSKSKQKSKEFSISRSKSKSKQFSRSKSISPSKSVKSYNQKSIQLLKQKGKIKTKDQQKSISISRELERQKMKQKNNLNLKVKLQKQKSNPKKGMSKSKQKQNQRKDKIVQKSKSKGKSISRQKIKSKSKSRQKHTISSFNKTKKSPSKQLHKTSKHKTEQISHKNSKNLDLKNTATNFYRPYKQKNKQLQKESQTKKTLSKNNNNKTAKKINLKNHLKLYQDPQFIKKVVFIQKMWRGYHIRKLITEQLKEIDERIQKVQTSISKKSAKYWNSNKSSSNSIQNIQQFSLDRNDVLAQRQKQIGDILNFKKSNNKLFERSDKKNDNNKINVQQQSFASQKNISISQYFDQSGIQIQKLRQKVNQQNIKNQKLLEQNEQLKQHILSISAKSKSQKSNNSQDNSPLDSQKHSQNKEKQLQREKLSSNKDQKLENKIQSFNNKQISKFSFKDKQFFQKLNGIYNYSSEKLQIDLQIQPQFPESSQQQQQKFKRQNQKKFQKHFEIIDMSPLIKTQQHDLQPSHKSQKSNKKLSIDINKIQVQQVQNNSNAQNSLKKKFQFYQCSPRSNSNINLSSILQNGEYQKKIIQCKILQEQFQRKIRLLDQIKRDNLISPKSFDIKVINLAREYKKNKQIIEEEIINSSRSSKSNNRSYNQEIKYFQKEKLFVKTQQKQNTFSQNKKNSISKYLDFQVHQQKQKQKSLNNQSSFEVHQSQNLNKFRLNSQEDQATTNQNKSNHIVNNEQQESFSKFFERIQKQQESMISKQRQRQRQGLIKFKQQPQGIIKIAEDLRRQGQKRIIQIANNSGQQQEENDQNFQNQMVSSVNESVLKQQKQKGFQTHLLYVKNLIFQFFDFVRKTPKFQKQIVENLLSCPYSQQDFLKTYRTRFDQISDIYVGKQEGEFQIYSYYKYLLDMKPIISPEIFSKFQDTRLSFQYQSNVDQDANVDQSMSRSHLQIEENEMMEMKMLKRIFHMFLFDALNQAFEDQRVDTHVSKGLSVTSPQLANFYPLSKSLEIFENLEVLGYDMTQINSNEDYDSDQQQPNYQNFSRQEIHIKKLLRYKGSLLDVIICNIVKKILEFWGRCLCGLIIQQSQQKMLQISTQQLRMKQQERMSIFLQKYLLQNETNMEHMLKEHKIWVKIQLQDIILKELLMEFIQELR